MSDIGDWLFRASLEQWELRFVYAAAPIQTAFILIYGSGIWSKWWRSLIGQALFTKALALALLLDLTVAADLTGYTAEWVRVTTFVTVVLILLGTSMQLAALVLDIRAGRERFQPTADI